MIFYKNYNLLIYLKIVMITLKPSRKVIMKKVIEDFKESLESFDFENDFFEVKEIERQSF